MNETIFLFAALILMLVACQKQTSCEDLRWKTVDLNDCTIDDKNENVRICFTSLQDSRCPLNATCVWQGIAVAGFTIRLHGIQHQVTLATDKIPGYPSTDTTVSGYQIKLLNITPYPESVTNEPVRASLQLTR